MSADIIAGSRTLHVKGWKYDTFISDLSYELYISFMVSKRRAFMPITDSLQRGQKPHANNQEVDSTKVAGEPQAWRAIATKFRKKRFVLFDTLISSLPRPLRILDVGGTERFWNTMKFNQEDVKILIYNWKPVKVTRANMESL